MLQLNAEAFRRGIVEYGPIFYGITFNSHFSNSLNSVYNEQVPRESDDVVNFGGKDWEDLFRESLTKVQQVLEHEEGFVQQITDREGVSARVGNSTMNALKLFALSCYYGGVPNSRFYELKSENGGADVQGVQTVVNNRTVCYERFNSEGLWHETVVVEPAEEYV